MIKDAEPVDLSQAEQEFWVSTRMQVLLMLHFMGIRRRLRDRELCSLFGARFLELLVPSSGVDIFLPWRIPAESMALCGEDAHGDQCCHLREVLGKLDRPKKEDSSSPQAYVWAVLVYLYEFRACLAVTHHLGKLITSIMQKGDDDIDRWADFSWQHGDAARLTSVARPRRIDPHLRRFIMEDGMSQGQGRTAGQVGSSVGVDAGRVVHMKHKMMSAYRASAVMSFSNKHVISACFDGGRLGRPARELLVGAFAAPVPDDHRDCAFPPQVRSSMIQ